MAGFDVQRVIAAFQQGRQIKDDKEKKLRDVEDRDFELKQRQAQLKMDTIQQQILKRKLEQENVGAMQGQPGEEFQIPGLSATPGGEREDVPGGVPTYAAPIPGVAPQTKDAPLPSMQVSGVEGLGVPGYTAQPKSMQEMLRQARGEKSFESQLKKEENTVTLPASLLGGKPDDHPVAVDKTIADNLISGVQQSARQEDSQVFTAGQNEAKAKADAEESKADRASREAIALANRVAAGQRALQSGKTNKAVQQAITMANQFDANAITKNYAIVREGADFARNLKGGTSADDIGLLYAFAKAMDPGSVVREGEYATVQKYAQSWAEQFGFKAQRIFSNTPFLSDQAKKNMIATIGSKETAAKRSYDNLRKEAGKKFENIGEKPESWLSNYDIEKSSGELGAPQTLVDPNGATLTLGADGKYH